MKIYKNGRTGKFVKTCPKIALKHICILIFSFNHCIEARHKHNWFYNTRCGISLSNDSPLFEILIVISI